MRHLERPSLNSNSQTNTSHLTAASRTSDSIHNYSRSSGRRCYLFAGIFTAAAGVLLARSKYRPTDSLSFQTPYWIRDPKRIFTQWSPFSRETTESHSATKAFVPTSSLKGPREKQNESATMYGGGSGVTVSGRGSPSGCIIFMHGLGDTGAGWSSAFPIPNLQHVEVILPTANIQPVSLNGGMPMPSWFDLHGLDENSAEDEDGIVSAVARVERIIDGVVAKGIPSDRVVVAGFSQGGAIALTTALRSQRKLAGVVALSTWLPLRQTYPQMLGPHAGSTPIFIAHGTADQVVRIRLAELSVKALQKIGIDASLSIYPGVTHSASEAELNDMANFLVRAIPPL